MSVSGAAISTYIGQFFSGGVDPSTPHLVLILLTVGGGLIVGIGIIWEAARAGHLWTIPTFLVLIGVVIEAAATVILFEFDEGISRGQQSTISKQQTQIIALEKRIAVRELQPSQQNEVAKSIHKFAPQPFEVSIGQGVGDGIVLWQSLAPAFSKADWIYAKPGPTNFTMGDPPAGIAIAAGPDVEILLPPATLATPRIIDAADTLALALRSVGIWAYPDFDPSTNNKTMIQIRIGVKTR